MLTEPKRDHIVDTRYEMYASFFDHAWARDFLQASSGTPLAEAAFTLCEGWKGAANTARLPWLTVRVLGDFTESFTRAAQSPSVGLLGQSVRQLASQVCPALTLEQQKSLQSVEAVYASQLDLMLQASPYKFDAQLFWQEMIQDSEFTLSLISAQRLAFIALYYSYEDFILSCYKIAAAIARHRIGRDFPNELAKQFGNSTAAMIWTDRPVQTAKLIRNAIMHNGCRETPELNRLGHNVQVVDGILQIVVTLLRSTFDELKPRAYAMLQQTLRATP